LFVAPRRAAPLWTLLKLRCACTKGILRWCISRCITFRRDVETAATRPPLSVPPILRIRWIAENVRFTDAPASDVKNKRTRVRDRELLYNNVYTTRSNTHTIKSNDSHS
jgi:hypothetical protein